MKVPTCKLCGKAHWASEEHGGEPSVPEYVRDMAAGAMGVTRTDSPPPTSTGPSPSAVIVTQDVPTTVSLQGDVPTCECGKPCEGRYKKCAACRKRAYRERSK